MPNQIDQNGLSIASIDEIMSTLTLGAIEFPGYLTIFPGANVSPNSPDGNLLNIFAQIVVDLEEFLQTIYDSMDPDQAFGATLDSRCAINAVTREAGTYTVQNVQVTATAAVSINGLDLYPTNAYTVADAQGNQYQLVETYSFSGAGTQTLLFQAANLGAVQSAPNTITSFVTVVAGISGVNNSTGPTLIGEPEETDAQLRIRRANSVANGSTGYVNGLEGVILAVPGVTGAVVLENDGPTVDSRGIPGHAIWAIVAGGGASFNAGVLNAVYTKKAGGCGQTNAGTGAAGTTALTPTSVASVVVAAGGSGYTGTPTVVFTGGGGTGAAGTATVVGNVVTAVTVTTPGTGYTSAPIIGFTGGSGTGAAATAILTATSVASITLTAPGVGYFNNPVVSLTGVGGTGATATATATAGVVSALVLGAGGSGYTSAPLVVFNPNTISATFTPAAGTPIAIYFDKPIAQRLRFRAQVDALTGNLPDLVWLAGQIASTTYKIGQAADSSSLVALIKSLAPNVYVSTEGVSLDGTTWSSIVNTTGVNYQFNLAQADVTLTT